MGGRGGSSHRATMASGIAGLGAKGRALTAFEALPLTNPNYNLARQYQINCQRCVWAFEMLRRGYFVEAARSDSSDYVGSVSSIRAFWFSASNARSENFIRLDYLASTVVDQYSIVEQKMREWGEGSRAVLANVWTAGGGHIWNVEYSGGKIHYFDGQIGREVDVANRNSRSSMLDIFARVDDLDIPQDIMKAVIPKKKR